MSPTLPAAYVGVWRAKDLAFLKVAGWQNMTITITPQGTFIMAGDNPYGQGGKLDIRGTVTVGEERAVRPIDLTIAASNNQMFFKPGEGMPGVCALSADGKELTIVWGSTQFNIARPATLAGGALFVKD